MKRVLTFLAIMLLPLSVWAMTPVSDSDLSNVTGQAGVNINANLTMDINIGTMAWGDNDGSSGVYNPWDTVGAGGYIGMVGFDITNLTIKARVADSYNYFSTLMLKPITIDVATGDKSLRGGSATTTFVRFGTGALQINMDALDFDVSLGARVGTGETAGTNSVVLDQNMGIVSLGGMGIYLSPWSYVDIYSAANGTNNTSGVVFDMNIQVDHFEMAYMSWGDKDGYAAGNQIAGTAYWFAPGTAYNSAGYIGLNNFAINGPIYITGAVQIDITTTNNGIYAILPNATADLVAAGMDPSAGQTAVAAWMAANSGTVYTATHDTTNLRPTSVVHISFPTDFIVNVDGSITASVELANSANFADNGTTLRADTLGDIYIQGFVMTMKSGSWVDIWAH